MALSARKELYLILNHWIATAAADDQHVPTWGDDRVGTDVRNSIADLEMMLCLLSPTFQLDSFSLSGIHEVSDTEVNRALRQLTKDENYGSALMNVMNARIRGIMERPLAEAFSPGELGTYVRRDGTLEGPDDEPPSLKPVDAYTLTISVCVQAMCLLRSWMEHSDYAKRGDTSERGREGFQETFDLCSERLTDALLGLLRSFSITTFSSKVGAGSQGGFESSGEWEKANGRVWPGLKAFRTADQLTGETLNAIRQRLATRFGIDRYPDLLRGQDIPFVCGFSWGPVRDEPWLGDPQLQELARDRPTFGEGEEPNWAVEATYLYFTIAAIEGVTDLLETKVRSANILNAQQAYLSGQLGFLVDNTTAYWRALAFASVTTPDTSLANDQNVASWTVERLPWRTADGDRDDYYSLYVIGLILGDRSELDRIKLERLLRLLEELAQRARVTREPYVFGNAISDPAIEMHAPGKRLTLEFAGDREHDKSYYWSVDDFAPKLLRLAGIIGQRTQDSELRRRALNLADQIWEGNLAKRGKEGLLRERVTRAVRSKVWDRPNGPYEAGNETDVASDSFVFGWHMTQRVADGLVAVVKAQERSTTANEQTRQLAQELLESLRVQGYKLGDSEARLMDAETKLISAPSTALREVLDVVSELSRKGDGSNSSGF